MRHYCYILLAGIILMTMAACGGQITETTLADTSASQLDLNVNLEMGYDASAQPRNTLTLDVFYHGIAVALTHHETMTCNSEAIALDPDNAGFIATDFSFTDTTTPIDCVYQSGTHTATFSLAFLPAPQVLVPKDNATINHSQTVLVTYVAGLGKTIEAEATVFGASHLVKNTWKNGPDNGSIILATQGLQAGAGFIKVMRSTDTMISGTSFHSLHVSGRTTTYIPVTWS